MFWRIMTLVTNFHILDLSYCEKESIRQTSSFGFRMLFEHRVGDIKQPGAIQQSNLPTEQSVSTTFKISNSIDTVSGLVRTSDVCHVILVAVRFIRSFTLAFLFLHSSMSTTLCNPRGRHHCFRTLKPQPWTNQYTKHYLDK